VDAAVTSDAGPDGIVALLRAVHGDTALDAVARAAADDEASVMRGAITAVSGPAGAGATEVAIALTSAFGTRAVLVDADDVAPAVAPRLGLPIEPNLRDAIDAVEYGDGELDAFVAPRANGLCVVGGLASATAWTQIRPPEMLRLVQRLATGGADRVVLDVAGALEDMPVATARPRHAVARALLGEADEIVAVGAATPVGVTRLLAWIADARAFASPSALHVVVNRAPKDAFRRGEIVDEIANAFAVASVTVVPNDRRVEAAAWAGALVGRGPFTRAVAALASELGRVDAGHRIAS
jgi:MinD-like ATPase involved in chromosome partitioning or flagellar assembly